MYGLLLLMRDLVLPFDFYRGDKLYNLGNELARLKFVVLKTKDKQFGQTNNSRCTINMGKIQGNNVIFLPEKKPNKQVIP